MHIYQEGTKLRWKLSNLIFTMLMMTWTRPEQGYYIGEKTSRFFPFKNLEAFKVRLLQTKKLNKAVALLRTSTGAAMLLDYRSTSLYSLWFTYFCTS